MTPPIFFSVQRQYSCTTLILFCTEIYENLYKKLSDLKKKKLLKLYRQSFRRSKLHKIIKFGVPNRHPRSRSVIFSDFKFLTLS